MVSGHTEICNIPVVSLDGGLGVCVIQGET